MRSSNYTESPLLGRHNTAISTSDLMDSNIELTPLKFAALSTHTQQIREILHDGVVSDLKEYLSDKNNLKSINDLDEDGFSLLHMTARWNLAEMTQILIDHGAQPDLRMKDCSTPLHITAR